MQKTIELNTGYPNNIGWRSISVREIKANALKLCVIGIAGKNEEIVVGQGETFEYDGVEYKLTNVIPRPDGHNSKYRCRHVAGILAFETPAE